jgi:hypothetical protein
MIKQTYQSKSRIKKTEKLASPSAQPKTETLVETVLSAGQATSAAGVSAPSCDSGPPPHQVIKLGIDVHLDRYVVVRQIDGGAPQPPQRFSPSRFLEWAKKQTALAKQVYSCYEAGPFGYRLHRTLKDLGITNYVVRPRDWDEYGKKVKTASGSAHSLDSAEKKPSQPTIVILAIGYGDAPQTSGISPGLHVPTLIRHFLW